MNVMNAFVHDSIPRFLLLHDWIANSATPSQPLRNQVMKPLQTMHGRYQPWSMLTKKIPEIPDEFSGTAASRKRSLRISGVKTG